MIKCNPVKVKRQLKSMSAYVYIIADGAEVLKSYDTVVAISLPDGKTAFSAFWTSTDGSNTTKRHIIEWAGTYIKDIREGLKDHTYKTLEELDKNYLRAISTAVGGRIG